MKQSMKQKKMNNKGFSLVELIIVIAIMAVLVGILAPQYIKYVENSRISADKTTVDQVASAIQTALANETVTAEITGDVTITFSGSVLTAVGGTELTSAVKETIDLSKTAMKSKAFKTAATNPTITIKQSDLTVTTDYKGY
ncbi:type IV pilus assembly protein PilA [Lachnotalea glycerini]|uniref:Type IV pilus assembly protein PilA n=2 Tax=Lachnotalea glycerini TaxID=1763509 RepID=A0A318EUY7_9FIRM|nr:prepilin-type N-terminal cleavage/methylation domain-containing protein [Lachnotalea glycerini]PXV93312.1 type IV pilus assembly protein PilA [Lachnotalea glycerini]